MKKKYLYMQVTKDEYELPLAVAGSVEELARMIGKSSNAIRSALYSAEKKGQKSQYIKIEVGDTDGI